MKSDSKSGLCINQVIASVVTLIVIGVSIELINVDKIQTQISKINNQGKEIQNTIEELQTIQIAERKINETSRSSQERNVVNTEEEQNKADLEEAIVEENKYISIEEITISQDMDLSIRCGISKEDFKTLMINLKTDSSGFFEENAEIIYDLCEEYEINEIFFCGLIAGESGWNIASNHRNKNNYISMMSGGKMIYYPTVEEGLEAAAKLLHNKYLTEGGSCYCGKTLAAVKTRFCPNSTTWVNLIYTCMKQVLK